MSKKGVYYLGGAFGLLGTTFFISLGLMTATLHLLAGICFLLLAREMLLGKKGSS